ncbi:hypothetical protein EI291_14795 [Hymenobacter rigui]|uniref:Uncharacterized protein n=2 Tax=Hymenobacter rigui TaxID=334424 RepID=A0A428KM75_9BACT|nr:hypothetical protein EI291_14795 [Hymenobacter rigui]
MLPTSSPPVLLALALLVAGCRKEKLENCPGQCTVITGQLLTSGLQPLAGAPVTARWHSGQGYSAPRTRARATTDANGRFQVSFYVKEDERQQGYFDLMYEVSKSRYYVLGNTDGPDTGAAGRRRDTTYHLPPFLIPRKAYVKLTVPNPDQIQDYFAVSFTSAHLHELQVTPQSIGGGSSVGIPRQGTPFTTLLEVAGDQKIYVQATRGSNGAYVRTLDSLIVSADVTRELTVRY